MADCTAEAQALDDAEAAALAADAQVMLRAVELMICIMSSQMSGKSKSPGSTNRFEAVRNVIDSYLPTIERCCQRLKEQ